MLEFFFDDEPIEHILYGEGPTGPSPANLYIDAHKALLKIDRLCKNEEMVAAVEAAATLGRSDAALSSSHVIRLNPLMSLIVGRPAMTKIRWDISPLEPLIKRLWQIVEEKQDPLLYQAVEPWIYRFFEHQGQYWEAKKLQSGFIQFYRKQKDRNREAGTINNFAYEFQFEDKFGEAADLFESAAEMHKEVGNKEDYANSRANYWICRFGGKNIDDGDIEKLEGELGGIARYIGQPGGWHERKVHVLRAKIMEYHGNIDDAIKSMGLAIRASVDKDTKYSELDEHYLKNLQRQKARELERYFREVRLFADDFLENRVG